ncbi:hypothetical protein BBJ28_00005493 [Nothophytophthora sp. Chile5]|nr:hypothetical protein BBJ28_00005493 [Nothophytophthora sp. Chile5]
MTKWWFVAVLASVLATPGVVLGACPNKCSGHGKCDLNDVCICMQNWIGGDCSGRQCPFTRAWHDTAQGVDDAHYYAECGNRGACDRATGECSCDAGFVGSGCRRMQCPNDCSGHGTCEFIEEMAQNTFDKRLAGVDGRTYQLWDQEKIMGCACDGGYEGHDCSQRTCPKGDDQLTPIQVEMKQAIVIDTGGAYNDAAPGDHVVGYLTYFDPYGNTYTTDAIKIFKDAEHTDSDNCAAIQLALQRLPNNVLNTVLVDSIDEFYEFTRTTPIDTTANGRVASFIDGGGATTTTKTICIVHFISEPGTTGYQNLLGCDFGVHSTSGQHPIAAGSADASCDVYEADTSTYSSFVAHDSLLPLTELNECSGRGTCDYATGTCQCFAGHMGLACNKQEALV